MSYDVVKGPTQNMSDVPLLEDVIQAVRMCIIFSLIVCAEFLLSLNRLERKLPGKMQFFQNICLNSDVPEEVSQISNKVFGEVKHS